MDAVEQVVILCGGRGTRLQEETRAIPKPLVEIGGRPILWHVIRLYAAQGLTRFLLLTGYRGAMIRDFVEGNGLPTGIDVECLDTGEDTPTGGRIKLAEERLATGTFCATYADGVADIDIPASITEHRAHGKAATMTVVRPFSQWGIARIAEDGRIEGFTEKPRLDYWINGGFFVLEPRFLDYLRDDSVLEREPLADAAADGQLHAYRHEGFWECMDTYKDATALNDLWAGGDAPWAIWEPGAASHAAAGVGER